MNTKFNQTIVETNGVKTVAGGGTGRTTASEALSALGGFPLTGGTITGDINVKNNEINIYGDAASSLAGQRYGLNLTNLDSFDPGQPLTVDGRARVVHGMTFQAGINNFTNGSDHSHVLWSAQNRNLWQMIQNGGNSASEKNFFTFTTVGYNSTLTFFNEANIYSIDTTNSTVGASFPFALSGVRISFNTNQTPNLTAGDYISVSFNPGAAGIVANTYTGTVSSGPVSVTINGATRFQYTFTLNMLNTLNWVPASKGLELISVNASGNKNVRVSTSPQIITGTKVSLQGNYNDIPRHVLVTMNGHNVYDGEPVVFNNFIPLIGIPSGQWNAFVKNKININQFVLSIGNPIGGYVSSTGTTTNTSDWFIVKGSTDAIHQYNAALQHLVVQRFPTSDTSTTTTGGNRSVALGNSAEVDGDFSYALGYKSTVTGCKSVALGGENNYVTGNNSSVLGGYCNTASGCYSNVAGGYLNTASEKYSNVAGGCCNTASNGHSNIAGGCCNTASGYASNVAGGGCNTASGCYSNVAGGYGNAASEKYSTVSGGYCNTASGCYSNVSGGCLNAASGCYSTIVGGFSSRATGTHSFVGGGQYNTASNNHSTVAGGKSNTASGCYSNVSGGRNNNASECYSNVAGGISNTASGIYSNVAGGISNTALGYYSNVAGGRNNTASGSYSNVSGGYLNNSCGNFSTVAGGLSSRSTGLNSFVGSGFSNLASGNYSAILGGHYNNTNNQCNTFILGSSITALSANFTYVNNLSSQGTVFANTFRVGSSVTTATGPVGTVVRKIQIFDSEGNSLGFIPVYNSIT